MKKRLNDYTISAVLSGVLYSLKIDAPPVHRAYTTKEILDACDALGFHPSDVGNTRIPYVLSWLKENKKQKRDKKHERKRGDIF